MNSYDKCIEVCFVVEYKSIKLTEENYDRLDKLRQTERGEVSFDDVISWLLKGVKQQ